jgi:uncharacterized Zn finger protein
MSMLPKITDRIIRKHVGDRSFNLGDDYFQSGAIFNGCRQGRTIKAGCQGSSGGPYHVEATFDDQGIADAECSCPVGDDGCCKHVAALLITWRHQPDEFIEVEETDTALERRSKPELNALVKQMLRRDPELEDLLEKPPSAKKGETADPETYRRRARDVFRSIGYGDGAAAGIADRLEPFKEEGDAFLAKKDYAGAAAVYESIASTVAEHFDMIEDEFDEENVLGVLVGSCVEGLARCLDGLKKDPGRRELTLRALWEVAQSSVDVTEVEEGPEEGPEEILVNRTTPEERRAIAAWVRVALSAEREGSHSWRRQEFGGLLLELEADTMDDETYLRTCRSTGRQHDLVDRLLQLGRLEEAIKEIEKADDYQLISLANLLVHHHHGEVAERLMQERAEKSRDWQVRQILDWLKERAAGRGDLSAVLDLSEKLFRVQPSLEGFKELHKLASKQRRWDVLRPELMAFLEQSHSRYVLTQIYLDEGDIDRALEEVKKERGHGPTMKLTVARVAEKARPQAALEIYRKEAEQYVQQKQRESYKSACQYLKQVRDLYRKIGDEAGWSSYVASLRNKHTALRALQDEMNKAQL